MNWALIVAGGRGTRMGLGDNKAFAELAGIPLLIRSVQAFATCASVDGILLVVGPGEEARARALLADWRLAQAVSAIVTGGEDRQASVWNGLTALPPEAERVLVHDAARPLVTQAVIEATLCAAAQGGSGVAAVALQDTVKRVDAAGRVLETPPRDALRAVQTPQTFAVALLRRAHAQALACGLRATDDAALVEALGEAVQLVTGDKENLKITTPEDMTLAEDILRRRQTLSCCCGAAEAAAIAPPFRVGQGYDVHRLVPDRALILCGVAVPYEKGLLGHSDADVAAHALSDALLGAAALGDIGQHFPDTDPAYAGADSLRLLAEVVRKCAALGWAVGNADVTIVAQLPKLKPYIPAMAQNLARVLGVAAHQVNVKATTTERLGFEGEGLGISAQATALLVRGVKEIQTNET